MATGHKIGCKACLFLRRKIKTVQGYKDKLFEALILNSDEEEQAGVMTASSGRNQQRVLVRVNSFGRPSPDFLGWGAKDL